jgi:hypothetical protein
MAATQHDSIFTWDRRQSQQFTYQSTGGIESPLTTPPSDITSFQQSSLHHPSNNNLIYTTSPDNNSSTSWAHTPVTTETNFECTGYIADPESTPIWWADAADTPLAEPLAITGYHRSEHNTKSLAMQLQADLAYDASELSAASMPSGLMIQTPSSITRKSFIVEPSSISPMAGDQQDFWGGRAAASAHPITASTPSQRIRPT